MTGSLTDVSVTPPIRSCVPGIAWPAVPSPFEATLLAFQHELDETQWWPADRLLEHQMRQLEKLIEHARQTVPFYRKRLGDRPVAPLSLDRFRKLPVLTRKQVSVAGKKLRSGSIPKGHGEPSLASTSGTTGRQLRLAATTLHLGFEKAMNLRCLRWHGLDFSATAAAIRAVPGGRAAPPEGTQEPSWAAGYQTGPLALLHIDASPDEQLDWLTLQQPRYLMTYPSNLAALAHRSETRGFTLPSLASVHTFGEVVEPSLRAQCERVWGVPLVDTYSALEAGMIAAQCPGYDHYHVMSEGALVEILDDEGRPCREGETGRVVVTPLHNFAAPLIRYEIGDYAEVGPACPCGRGLPVLNRILGQARNMLVAPDGERSWPRLDMQSLREQFPLRQMQIVQKSRRVLEVKLVRTQSWTPDIEERLRRTVCAHLGHDFKMRFRYVKEIPSSPSRRFEPFRSELSARS